MFLTGAEDVSVSKDIEITLIKQEETNKEHTIAYLPSNDQDTSFSSDGNNTSI